MRLVLLGSPGVGKGTQAKFIKEKYHIAQISTGDMLRAATSAGTPLGNEVKQIMDEGRYVSDEIMIQLVRSRIQQPDCVKGFLLDGFPRTLPQAEALFKHHIYLNFIIEISVSDEEIVKRLTGRRVHVGSGRVYHIEFNPPRVENRDDVTGEELELRVDDEEHTVRKRLAVYHQQTEPLIEYYIQKMKTDPEHAPVHIRVDGVGTVDEVKNRIFAALQSYEYTG